MTTGPRRYAVRALMSRARPTSTRRSSRRPTSRSTPGRRSRPGDDPSRRSTDDVREPLAQYPPVVAVIVTRNPGPWLEDTLGGLGGPGLPRPHGARRRLRLRRRPDAAGRRGAAAARSCAGSTTAPASPPPPTRRSRWSRARRSSCCATTTSCSTRRRVRVLVEEAYRSNAGIVGPEARERRRPRGAARGRARHRPLRRALHRHRARRARPGAARRRARRLLRHHRDDARARRPLRGARRASTRRPSRAPRTSTSAGAPGSPARACSWRPTRASRTARPPRSARAPTGPTSPRSRAAACACCFTSYSFLTLLWLVPVRHRRRVHRGDRRPRHRSSAPRPCRASAAGSRTCCTFGAWRASRKRAQALRHVHDRDLRELQVGSATRLGAFFTHHLHTDDRLRSFGDAQPHRGRLRVRRHAHARRDRVPRRSSRSCVVGSRDLITERRAVDRHARSRGRASATCSTPSARRGATPGSARPSPAPSAARVDGRHRHRAVRRGRARAHARGGARDAARRVRRVPPRARRLIDLRGPAFAAGLAYGVNPVARNAIAEGRLGPLVMFALLPFLLSQLRSPADRDRARRRRPRRRGSAGRVLALRGRSLALRVGAWYPLTAAFAVRRRRGRVRGRRRRSPAVGARALRALGITVVGALGAVVLLFPWPLAYVDSRSTTAPRSASRSGPTSTCPTSCASTPGPPARGLGDVGPRRGRRGAAVRRHRRRGSRGRRAAGCSRSSGGPSVWVPARFAPDTVGARARGRAHARRARARAARSASACRCSSTASARSGSAGASPRRSSVAIAILLPGARLHRRRRRRPVGRARIRLGRARSRSPSRSPAKGEFRMLWVGDPDVLPLDPVVLDDGTGYTLTRNGPGDADRAAARARARRRPRRRRRDRARRGRAHQPSRAAARARWACATSPCRRTQGPRRWRARRRCRRGCAPRSPGSSTSRACGRARGLVLYENLAWIPLRAR